MSPEAVKDRLNRAVEQAARTLGQSSPPWDVSFLRGHHVFQLEAVRPKEVLCIRIVLDKMTDNDLRIVREKRLPDIFTRAIWLKKRGSKRFEIHEI